MNFTAVTVEHNDSFHMFRDAGGGGLRQMKEYELTSLSSSGEVLSASIFTAAVQRCPKVESILVSGGGPGDEGLR